MVPNHKGLTILKKESQQDETQNRLDSLQYQLTLTIYLEIHLNAR